jgi:hypothetical protein
MYNYYAREFFLSVTVSQMDGDHFVSVSVIAGFSKVKRLTTDINLIMDAIRGTIQMYMYMSCFYQLTHTFIHKHTLTFIHKHIHTYNVHTYTLPRP